MEDILEIAKGLLPRAQNFSNAEILKVEHIAGDASGRRFFRIFMSGAACSSVVLMKLKEVYEGKRRWSQADTFVELSPFFREQGVNVPTILSDLREQGYVLVEDFGDVSLWHFVFDKLNGGGTAIKKLLGDNCTEVVYKKTVDIIPKIQACGKPSCYSFQEEMGFDLCRLEIQRMIDHYLMPQGFTESEIGVVSKAFDALSEEVASHPKVLIHRDYMPWNIQVLRDGEIGILDFQDAFMGSPAYDLVSLLHDRDVDFALGREFVEKIVQYHVKRNGLGASFIKQYRQALLQRFCRLAGQFVKLTIKFGNPAYQNWVPGCLRRIGWVMGAEDYFSDTLQILYDRIPEFRDGVDNHWNIAEKEESS